LVWCRIKFNLKFGNERNKLLQAFKITPDSELWAILLEMPSTTSLLSSYNITWVKLKFKRHKSTCHRPLLLLLEVFVDHFSTMFEHRWIHIFSFLTHIPTQTILSLKIDWSTLHLTNWLPLSPETVQLYFYAHPLLWSKFAPFSSSYVVLAIRFCHYNCVFGCDRPL